MERPIYEFEPKFGKNGIYVADTVVDGWSSRSFILRAACVRGYAHRFNGMPRQDQFSLTEFEENGSIVVAVADGVSASPLSSVGATLACRSAIDWCKRRASEEAVCLDQDWNWDVDIWRQLLRNAAWGLIDYAHTNLNAPKDALEVERILGTTLTVAVLTPKSDGTANLVATQIGDSDIWVMRGREYHAVTPHARSLDNESLDIASTAIAALPRLPAQVEPMQMQLLPGDVLLVGSDGFGSALGDGSGSIGKIFANLLANIPRPLELAHTLDFSRELFDDDRTLIALWIKPSLGEGV
ncbi:protein phosphatase 2C domain-containing protein [Streptomyces alanosinicus]|uniref:protein phosphatase 2C domain-containing protein n=1 Tax=Streptomyces alanosinicus TaxID=68171 RepID=UPI00167A7262|nr:protein phosphatase 2C domain-containing protein [Streptomyces alanosinicus]